MNGVAQAEERAIAAEDRHRLEEGRRHGAPGNRDPHEHEQVTGLKAEAGGELTKRRLEGAVRPLAGVGYSLGSREGSRERQLRFLGIVREGFAERRIQLEANEREQSLKNPLSAYEERLASEIETIKETRFSSYFLIVWDLVKHARDNNIPVGPGRGSVVGSLVA